MAKISAAGPSAGVARADHALILKIKSCLDLSCVASYKFDMKTKVFLLVAVFSLYAGAASPDPSCTAGVDASTLTAITLVGEYHNAAAKRYWADLLRAKKETADYMSEGACVDAKEQADRLIADWFPAEYAHLVMPVEESYSYSIGLTLHHFEEIGRILSTEQSLREIAKLEEPFSSEAITNYVNQSKSAPIQYFLEANGVSIIQKFELLLTMDPTGFGREFDNRMFGNFNGLMSEATVLPPLRSSVEGTLDAFEFGLEGSATLEKALRSYSVKHFVPAFQEVSALNEKPVRDELLRFVNALLLHHASVVELHFQESPDKPDFDLSDAVTEYARIYTTDLKRKEELDDQILAQWRNRFIARNVYEFYCRNLKGQKLKPIFVRIGAAHVDDLKAKLSGLFGDDVTIATTEAK